MNDKLLLAGVRFRKSWRAGGAGFSARLCSRWRCVLSLAVQEEHGSVSMWLQLFPARFMKAFALPLIDPQ